MTRHTGKNQCVECGNSAGHDLLCDQHRPLYEDKKMPVRIQLRRTKGWRMPENTVKVDRTTKWGNPYSVVLDEVRYTGEDDEDGNPIMTAGPWLCSVSDTRLAGIWFATKEEAVKRSVELFRHRLEHTKAAENIRAGLEDLRGKNLACWCAPGADCHADVLLELTNATPGDPT